MASRTAALLASAGGGVLTVALVLPAALPAARASAADETAAAGASRPGSAEAHGGAGRSLVLVVDTSASMAVNDPGARVREAVAQVADGLAGADVVGLVTFDSGARVAAPMSRLDELGARSRLRSAIAALEFRGRFTDIPDAVERALYELQRPGRETGERLIVLVTDGLIDTGDPQRDEKKQRWLRDDLLPSCRELGIRVFGVAFTEGADYELLRTMATTTGGGYYRALTAEDVPGIFAELERALSSPPPPPPKEPEPAVSAVDVGAAVKEAVAEIEANRPPPPEPETDLLLPLIGGSLGLLALLLAAYAVLRSRRADREGMPVVQATLHDLETGESYQLSKRVTRIGRSPESDVVLDSVTVSGQHAIIEAKDGVYHVADLRSTNGTFLNETRIEREEILRRGDVIRFDRFKFAFDGLLLDEETQVTSDAEQTQVRVNPWADRD